MLTRDIFIFEDFRERKKVIEKLYLVPNNRLAMSDLPCHLAHRSLNPPASSEEP